MFQRGASRQACQLHLRMGSTAFLVAIATLLLAGNALAQTTQVINKFVPVTAKIQTSLTVGYAQEVTPVAPAKRRLVERLVDEEDAFSIRRKLLATPQSSGPPVVVPAEFTETVGAALLNPVNTTRKLLQTSDRLTFYGSIKQDFLTGQASAVYIFNQDSVPFLKVATQSGTSFKFLKAVLILPQEQSATVVPPSVSSASGFLSTNPSQPVIVKLTTKGATGFVPNVGLRFDYSSSQPNTTPFFSIYYSDLVGTYPSGVPKANLAQSYGIYIGKDGTIYPGQSGK
ncbi:hypothetical protein COCOBI_05-1400 [Coccomyxa sp. Obi]|nr:hypothetical protein COCOBI_05-1400 [Coccomyxa sp. Obi]